MPATEGAVDSAGGATPPTLPAAPPAAPPAATAARPQKKTPQQLSLLTVAFQASRRTPQDTARQATFLALCASGLRKKQIQSWFSSRRKSVAAAEEARKDEMRGRLVGPYVGRQDAAVDLVHYYRHAVPGPKRKAAASAAPAAAARSAPPPAGDRWAQVSLAPKAVVARVRTGDGSTGFRGGLEDGGQTLGAAQVEMLDQLVAAEAGLAAVAAVVGESERELHIINNCAATQVKPGARCSFVGAKQQRLTQWEASATYGAVCGQFQAACASVQLAPEYEGISLPPQAVKRRHEEVAAALLDRLLLACADLYTADLLAQEEAMHELVEPEAKRRHCVVQPRSRGQGSIANIAGFLIRAAKTKFQYSGPAHKRARQLIKRLVAAGAAPTSAAAACGATAAADAAATNAAATAVPVDGIGVASLAAGQVPSDYDEEVICLDDSESGGDDSEGEALLDEEGAASGGEGGVDSNPFGVFAGSEEEDGDIPADTVAAVPCRDVREFADGAGRCDMYAKIDERNRGNLTKPAVALVEWLTEVDNLAAPWLTLPKMLRAGKGAVDRARVEALAQPHVRDNFYALCGIKRGVAVATWGATVELLLAHALDVFFNTNSTRYLESIKKSKQLYKPQLTTRTRVVKGGGKKGLTARPVNVVS
eukprot:COSAG01_NODE_967_length_12384_cov_3.880505_7_plen_650_part_00